MIPVPIGMWNPLSDATAHMHLGQEHAVEINHEIAAVLICYEQTISWPIIAVMIDRPTAIIAVANDHWASGTAIPTFQRVAVRSWAALLNIPYVSMANCQIGLNAVVLEVLIPLPGCAIFSSGSFIWSSPWPDW